MGAEPQDLQPRGHSKRPDTWLPEKGGTESGEEVFEEIMTENSPNLVKDIQLQVQDALQT